MVKKKNREPAFGTLEYYQLRAKRFRLKAYIEEDPKKKLEHLNNALIAEHLAGTFQKKHLAGTFQKKQPARKLPATAAQYIRERETASIVYA